LLGQCKLAGQEPQAANDQNRTSELESDG